MNVGNKFLARVGPLMRDLAIGASVVGGTLGLSFGADVLKHQGFSVMKNNSSLYTEIVGSASCDFNGRLSLPKPGASEAVEGVVERSMLKGQNPTNRAKKILVSLVEDMNKAEFVLREKIVEFEKNESKIADDSVEPKLNPSDLIRAANEVKKAYEEFKKCCSEVELCFNNPNISNRKPLAEGIKSHGKAMSYFYTVNPDALLEKANLFELFSTLNQLCADLKQEDKEWEESVKKSSSQSDLESKLTTLSNKLAETRKKYEETKSVIDSKIVFEDDDLMDKQLNLLSKVSEGLVEIEDKTYRNRLEFMKNEMESAWGKVNELAESNPNEYLKLVREDDAFNSRRWLAQSAKPYVGSISGFIMAGAPQSNLVREFRDKESKMKTLLSEVDKFKSQSTSLRNKVMRIETDLPRMEKILKVPSTGGWTQTVSNPKVIGGSVAGVCAVIAISIWRN